MIFYHSLSALHSGPPFPELSRLQQLPVLQPFSLNNRTPCPRLCGLLEHVVILNLLVAAVFTFLGAPRQIFSLLEAKAVMLMLDVFSVVRRVSIAPPVLIQVIPLQVPIVYQRHHHEVPLACELARLLPLLDKTRIEVSHTKLGLIFVTGEEAVSTLPVGVNSHVDFLRTIGYLFEGDLILVHE